MVSVGLSGAESTSQKSYAVEEFQLLPFPYGER